MGKSIKIKYGEAEGSFSEREVKAFLQVCKGIDMGKITEAVRSKEFILIRNKFQIMMKCFEEERRAK